ncbi:MAG: hypothetical protein LBG28_14405 [Tannerella sp.]|jgi:hypothetical protein|nr:hypothetical protein [Tannerella sp.]
MNFLKYKPTNEDMIASAKFMTPGASDEIFVRILSSGDGFAPEKVHFVTDKGKDYNGVYDEEKRGMDAYACRRRGRRRTASVRRHGNGLR